MVGTISLSLSQQFDALGNPLSGGLLYFRQAGTVATPQNAFQDTALTIPHPNPIVLSAGGRVPQFYLADGSIKIVLTDRHGDTQVTADNILVVGPSGGGGGGGGVDPTTVFSAGDVKSAYGTAVLSGWVRANGRTIGSATSGATERANADTQTLFVYLYGADTNLAVSGGRGASAAADFAANKTIALPDFRGRVLAGFDDMGNSAASRLTALGGMTSQGIGGVGGGETVTLITQYFPPYTPAGSFSSSLNSGTLVSGTLNSGTLNSGFASVASNNWVASSASDSTPFSLQSGSSGALGVSLTGGLVSKIVSTGSVTGTVSGTVSGTVTGSVSGTITGTAQGGTSTPFSRVQPTIFVTTYLKL